MTSARHPYSWVKRVLDVIFSGLALLIVSPLLAVLAVLVRVNLGSPVLFGQERPGRNANTFTILKFRSMLDVDETAGLVTDEARLTAFGRFLRSTSLDELPALVNVFRGEMSVVGPRPLLMKYLPLYTAHQARRHEVRPGITGLAQVSGRNALDWEQRFDLDVEYVDTYSFAVDFRILLRTVGVVFSRSGISADGEATMTEFRGSGPTGAGR